MADISLLAPAQPSQPSRKGKKAWRKNVDLTELQEGLEQVRQDIIQGGVVRELPSDALFTTDALGSHNIQASYNRRNKPLKADQILAQRSAIPAVTTAKRSADSGVTDGIVLKKRRMNNLSHREYHRLRKIAYGGDSVQKNVVKADGDASFDPWDQPGAVQPKEFDFCDEIKPNKEPTTLKEEPISMAADGRRIRAVRKPAPEKSYNPTSQDWLRRIQREGDKEVENEGKRLEALKKEQERQERIAKALAEDDHDTEWETEWESEWEGIASGAEEAPEWLVKKRPERKTKVQRNKINRRKAEEGLKKHEAKDRLKKQQTERLRIITRQVKEEERLKQEKLDLQALVVVDDNSSDDEKDVELKRLQPFGKARILDAPLEVLLTEDLTESLRTLKPEGNVLKDRYRSLLLQGKVESRKAVQPAKKEEKYTEKWSYKDWKLR